MGAQTFLVRSKGHDDNIQKAFWAAQEEAAWEYGHGGYTGTLAEKYEWVEFDDVEPLPLEEARAKAESLLDDPRVDDKWGPAGALRIKDGGWLFFGWASS
jgi:hypothetical protein